MTGPEDNLTQEEISALLSKDWEPWADDTYDADPPYTIDDAIEDVENTDF